MAAEYIYAFEKVLACILCKRRCLFPDYGIRPVAGSVRSGFCGIYRKKEKRMVSPAVSCNDNHTGHFNLYGIEAPSLPGMSVYAFLCGIGGTVSVHFTGSENDQKGESGVCRIGVLSDLESGI